MNLVNKDSAFKPCKGNKVIYLHNDEYGDKNDTYTYQW